LRDLEGEKEGKRVDDRERGRKRDMYMNFLGRLSSVGKHSEILMLPVI
jgi:hypothetical protein